LDGHWCFGLRVEAASRECQSRACCKKTESNLVHRYFNRRPKPPSHPNLSGYCPFGQACLLIILSGGGGTKFFVGFAFHIDMQVWKIGNTACLILP
jgi:hypothetical protein